MPCILGGGAAAGEVLRFYECSVLYVASGRKGLNGGKSVSLQASPVLCRSPSEKSRSGKEKKGRLQDREENDAAPTAADQGGGTVSSSSARGRVVAG